MASISERPVPPKSAGRRFADTFPVWNRKLHYYCGLYFLFFLWLFAFSGLLLNHTHWKFAEFWPQRHQSTFERSIEPPHSGGDLEQARDIMRQLGLHGEVEWTVTQQDPARFDFRVIRPGHVYEVKSDLNARRANVQQIALNAWGVLHVIHTFSGVRIGNPRMQRDWLPTTLWAYSMDALAAGLLFMVFSSLYMWYGLKQKRRWGVVALVLGVASCGLFLTGLAWIY
jgi:hypothetical protein